MPCPPNIAKLSDQKQYQKPSPPNNIVRLSDEKQVIFLNGLLAYGI
jgi:hypothetical protein